MDILFLLVPMSVLLALLVIAVFAYALEGGQFDDLDGEGERILGDEPAAGRPALDSDQAAAAARPEQCTRLPPPTPR